jgi:hypothetical protein
MVQPYKVIPGACDGLSNSKPKVSVGDGKKGGTGDCLQKPELIFFVMDLGLHSRFSYHGAGVGWINNWAADPNT